MLAISLYGLFMSANAQMARHEIQEIKVANSACFDSIQYRAEDPFSPVYDGEIVGIKLVHSSGHVTCNFKVGAQLSAIEEWSYWGCRESHLGFQLIENGVGSVYPTATTEGISGFDLKGCSTCRVRYYNIDGVSPRNSKVVVLKDENNPIMVKRSQTFSLQYYEGCCGFTTHDNLGVSCADVYFLYVSGAPTPRPTPAPTRPEHCLPCSNPECMADRMRHGTAAQSALGDFEDAAPEEYAPAANNYVIEFATGKDMLIVVLVLFNVLLIVIACCLAAKALKAGGSRGYAAVRAQPKVMFDEVDEEEVANINAAM